MYEKEEGFISDCPSSLPFRQDMNVEKSDKKGKGTTSLLCTDVTPTHVCMFNFYTRKQDVRNCHKTEREDTSDDKELQGTREEDWSWSHTKSVS